jgi:hypothetical protein
MLSRAATSVLERVRCFASDIVLSYIGTQGSMELIVVQAAFSGIEDDGHSF